MLILYRYDRTLYIERGGERIESTCFTAADWGNDMASQPITRREERRDGNIGGRRGREEMIDGRSGEQREEREGGK